MKFNAVDHSFHVLKEPVIRRSALYQKYRDEWNRRPQEFDHGDFPIHVDIETTTICNLKCTMCFHSFDKPVPRVMDEATVYKIIDECSGKAYSMKFQYRGEPLTDKNLPKYIEYAKRKGIVEVMINTNANLLTPDMADKLIEAGLDKIIFSVEGSSPEIYDLTRIGGSFSKVVGNIHGLMQKRAAQGLSTPETRVQMVRTEENAGDVKKYLKFWKKRVDTVAVEDEFDYRADQKDETVLEDWACPQIWQRVIILADGDIVPCCRSIIGGTGKQVVLGNIHETTIQKVWSGKILRDLRWKHKDGFSHQIDMCARCGLRKDVVKKVKE